MKDIIIRDFREYAEYPQLIKDVPTKDYWYAMDYEIGGVKGKMLAAGEECETPELVLNLKLNGWYKIYIAMLKPGGDTRLYIKLSSEEDFTSVYAPKENPPSNWMPYEYAEEFFYKSACLTGEKIIIKKPKVASPTNLWLVYLRFTEMTEAEVKEYKEYVNAPEYKNAHYHYDGNDNGMEEFTEKGGTLKRYMALKDSDADICSVEVTFDYDIQEIKDEALPYISIRRFTDGDKKYRENKEVLYKEKIDFLHKNNIEALACFRMSLASFGIDDRSRGSIGFVENHPEYYCKTRDGRTFKTCSYAYNEVQSYAIEVFKDALKYGFDGVSLILHRGLLIGFEEPVIKRFKEKYPGVDPCTLPIKDKRLNGIWCDILTEFMTKLRNELDAYKGERVKINVIIGVRPETAKHIGFDVEAWAEKRLIDSLCQDTMEVYENVDDCMENGFIDLKKYTEKNKVTETVRRVWSYEPEKILEGAKAYKELCDKYNVKFYGCIFAWQGSSKNILDNQKLLRSAGVNNISVFNFIHSSVYKPFYHALSHICHDDINEEYLKVKFIRTQMLDGVDISSINPNWRG